MWTKQKLCFQRYDIYDYNSSLQFKVYLSRLDMSTILRYLYVQKALEWRKENQIDNFQELKAKVDPFYLETFLFPNMGSDKKGQPGKSVNKVKKKLTDLQH